MEDVVAAKTVMRQSLFDGAPLAPEANLVAAASQVSRLVVYALVAAGVSVAMALAALAVALLR
jgi:hypothetical protein